MIGTIDQESRPRLDWPQLIAVVLLLGIGAAFIHSATSSNEVFSNRPWYRQPSFWHLVYGAIGLTISTVMCWFDYRQLARWAIVVYWGSILLLVCVFIFGKDVYGARRWIEIGPGQIQPSEFAKIGFIFMMAHYLSRPLEELRQPKVFWRAIGLMVLPFLLILKEHLFVEIEVSYGDDIDDADRDSLLYQCCTFGNEHVTMLGAILVRWTDNLNSSYQSSLASGIVDAHFVLIEIRQVCFNSQAGGCGCPERGGTVGMICWVACRRFILFKGGDVDFDLRP